MKDSQQLLGEYVKNGSEAAFGELVARYLDLVYSAALRSVNGDAHLAEDIAQTVFLDLARMGQTISTEVMLGGWLHRHTCFVAANTLRGERRRQSRERQALEMTTLQNQPDLSSISAILDEAINELGDADRKAVLLRFFEQRDFRSMAEVLGSSEDAARMRVTRALEKLCTILKRRGVTASVATVSALMGASAVQAAPAGLALVISTAALAGKTIPFAAAAATTKAIAMTTLQKSILGATLAVAVGAGIYEVRQASDARQENLALQQHRASLVQQTQNLARERDAAARQLALLRADNERLTRDAEELVKLRSEVARLRNESRMQSKVGESNDPGTVQARAWADRVKWLQQRSQQWSRKTIPELQLLDEQDWLNEVAADQLDSDKACRQAMSRLRSKAKIKLAASVKEAMEQFIKANNGQLPSDLSQLTPFLNPSLESCLQGYEFAKPGWVSLNNKHPLWAVVERGGFSADGSAIRDGSTLSDPEFDEYRVISSEGNWGYPAAAPTASP